MSTRGSHRLKLLDRYVGIPLVALGALRPKRDMPADIRRIGLMKTAAIGDTVLLAGLVDDVKSAYSSVELALITGLDNAGVAPLLGPAVDRTVTVSPSNIPASIRTLRALRLDALVDLGAWPRFDALLAAFSGARFTAGFRTAGQHRHHAYDATADHSGTVHERTNYERLLQLIGVSAHTPPRLFRTNTLRAEQMPTDTFAVFHPWSSGYRHEVKEWPTDRWIALGTAVSSTVERILITGGRNETRRTRALVEQMVANGISATDMSGKFTLPELTDLLAASRFVVSVNTGVAHLAALAGARTVSLEGPTPAVRWAPLGPRVRTVTTAYERCGYLDLGFEYDGQRLDCMEGISVDAVERALTELLTAVDHPIGPSSTRRVPAGESK